MSFEFETAVIRKWKGFWAKEAPARLSKQVTQPAGGFVLTFHRGFEPPHKAEHYQTVEEIQSKYPGYAWLDPMPGDADDIILVGV